MASNSTEIALFYPSSTRRTCAGLGIGRDRPIATSLFLFCGIFSAEILILSLTLAFELIIFKSKLGETPRRKLPNKCKPVFGPGVCKNSTGGDLKKFRSCICSKSWVCCGFCIPHCLAYHYYEAPGSKSCRSLARSARIDPIDKIFRKTQDWASRRWTMVSWFLVPCSCQHCAGTGWWYFCRVRCLSLT